MKKSTRMKFGDMRMQAEQEQQLNMLREAINDCVVRKQQIAELEETVERLRLQEKFLDKKIAQLQR